MPTLVNLLPTSELRSKPCKHGHSRSPGTDFVNAKGYLECRECRAMYSRAACAKYRQSEKYAAHYQRNLKRRRERAADDPVGWRAQKRKHELSAKYGLSQERYDAMLQEQGNACASCRGDFAATPCVDHDHGTGAVRALLCSPCNKAAGLLGDSSARADSVARYLRKHGR